MRWDLFCRVVDNFGDVGVCWRLACELARRGDAVRLWIDDASALAWMAPDGMAGVEVGAFDAAAESMWTSSRMYTLWRPGVPSDAFSMRSRIASTPLLLAASSSCTS